MAYIFEEKYFKNHLKNGGVESWFSKNPSNVRYKNRAGTYNLHQYADKYTISIKNLLIDPGISIDELISEARTMDFKRDLQDSTHSFTLGLFSDVPSTTYLKTNLPSSYTTSLLNKANNHYENIYFTLTSDNSKWVSQEVPVNGIKQVAMNICEWSNQVWEEKFKIQEVDSVIKPRSHFQLSPLTMKTNEEDIARKGRELKRKEQIFNLYIEKKNEEGIERLEKEITELEEEIDKLKLEQQQLSQIKQTPLSGFPNQKILQVSKKTTKTKDKEETNTRGVNQEIYECLWDFDGENKEDLSFKCGDRLEIIEKVHKDWWRGKKDGRLGLVPSNYLKKVNEKSSQSQLQAQIEIPTKK